MRIGINAFPLRTEGGGARFVFTGLVGALLRLESRNQYVIFTHLEGLRLVHQVLAANGEVAGSGHDARVRVVQIADEGQIYAFRHEFDLYFGPLNNLNPRLYDRPTVGMLLDIQEQYLPENFSKAELLARNEVYPEICHASTTVLTISNFCKDTFVEKFGIDPRKIEVVYLAPQAALVDAGLDDGVWRRDPLPAGYLFCPANTYKHKNHKLLLDALQTLRAAGETVPPVVFSGFELPGGYPLRKEVAARGLDDLCRFYTDLPVEELRYVYRHALAMVMPTKFEGFCMPAVEAAACKCPVICSDLPTLREMVGDNALYFDPQNANELAEQIRRVGSDGALRERLSEAGPSVAARFNWDASGRQLLKIFQTARERFIWGYAKPGTAKRPRIGVSIRLVHAGADIGRTVETLLVTGYPDLVLRCVVDTELKPDVQRFLESAGVQCVKPGEHAPGSFEDLRAFAQQHSLDLVGEVMEGNRVKPSGLNSIAWSYLVAPEKAVHLAECYQWKGEHFVGVSRMRLTGDGLWKMEGYLYPEAAFVNVHALERWPQGTERALAAGDEWRWELVREARQSAQLFMSRRTIADCDQGCLSAQAKGQAAKIGMFDYYNAANERSVKVKFLRRVEPAIKRAARVLPMKWQDAGTRLWYHLAR